MTKTKTPSELRSRIMRAVKSQDTTPELAVRKLVHGLGYRFRLRRNNLPGKPDLVFVSKAKVLFVHGCFWHGHACVRGARVPKTNTSYWVQKVARNKKRDRTVRSQLKSLGWMQLDVWECEIRRIDALEKKIAKFLRS